MRFVDLKQGQAFKAEGQDWVKKLSKSACGRFAVNAYNMVDRKQTRFFNYDHEVHVGE